MTPAHVTQHSKPTFTGLVAVVSLLLLCAAATSHATVYYVTKTQDTNDGACNADCSLREAIVAANGHSGNDVISLPAGRYTLTIPGSDEDDGATGDLDIRGDGLFIGGQGPSECTIDASGLGDRVIHVLTSDALVVLYGLTITGGSGPLLGGGICHQQGELTLTNVRVTGNHAAGGGGGVYSYLAALTVQDGSVISNNSASASWSGGGLTGNNLTVTDSTVSGNRAGAGGGISTTGLLLISGSTIAYNQTLSYDGGAIDAAGAVIEIGNTTLAGNYSARIGGAIHAVNGTSVGMNGVTFSGNSSSGGDTLHAYGSSVYWTNTLFSGACFFEAGTTSSSNGGNLESPGNTCNLADPTDHVNVADPMLAPLGFYGGPTQILLPKLGSPAIDNGYDYNCVSVDQRGEPRDDGDCDVGAVERQPDDQDPIFVDGFESGNTSAW